MFGEWDLPTVQGYEAELLGYFAQAAGIDASDASITLSQEGEMMKIEFTAKGTHEQIQAVASENFAQTLEETIQEGNNEMHRYLYTDSTSASTRMSFCHKLITMKRIFEQNDVDLLIITNI